MCRELGTACTSKKCVLQNLAYSSHSLTVLDLGRKALHRNCSEREKEISRNVFHIVVVCHSRGESVRRLTVTLRKRVFGNFELAASLAEADTRRDDRHGIGASQDDLWERVSSGEFIFLIDGFKFSAQRALLEKDGRESPGTYKPSARSKHACMPTDVHNLASAYALYARTRIRAASNIMQAIEQQLFFVQLDLQRFQNGADLGISKIQFVDHRGGHRSKLFFVLIHFAHTFTSTGRML